MLLATITFDELFKIIFSSNKEMRDFNFKINLSIMLLAFLNFNQTQACYACQ